MNFSDLKSDLLAQDDEFAAFVSKFLEKEALLASDSQDADGHRSVKTGENKLIFTERVKTPQVLLQMCETKEQTNDLIS
jgi:lambda repressor-like predicted transcriptional regulator